MNKKMKNAIRDSFEFPESKHKEDFFRQTQLSYPDKRRKTVPVAFRAAAAAAALVLGAGVWNAVKFRPEHNIDEVEEPPAVTTISDISLPQTTAATSAEDNAVHTTKTAVTTASSVTKTTVSQKNKVTVTSVKNTDKTATAVAGASGNTNRTAAQQSSSYTTVTTINDTGFFPDEGGSFSMKKISAFAASLIITAANALPSQASTTHKAEDFLEFRRNDTYIEYQFSRKGYMREFAGHEDVLDFNEDGKFDMWDVYAHYRSSCDLNAYDEVWIHEDGSETVIPARQDAPENIRNNVKAHGDFNHDGSVDDDDFHILVNYYSLNNPVPYEYLEPNNIYLNCPDKYENPDAEGVFDQGIDEWTMDQVVSHVNGYKSNLILSYVMDVAEYTSNIYSGYSTFCDMVDKGIIDIDINGDGVFSFNELCDSISANYLCYWSQLPEYGEDSELEEYGVARNTEFTEEEWAKLRHNAGLTRATLSYAFDSNYYYVAYFFENNEFKKGYADDYRYGKYRGGYFKYNINTYMTEYLRFAMPGVYSPRFDYTQEEIKNDFTSYYSKVKSGELPEPDINMNGTIEFEDYIYADLILAESYLGGDPKYPQFDKKIRDNYLENCDFNQNEMSGDLSDTICIQLYVVKELGIPEEEVVNEIARYYRKHPEWDIYDYEHYLLPEDNTAEETEEAEFDGSEPAQTGIKAIKSYMSNIDIFIPRSGDANNDGNVDISDAVLIMQTYANPDKYQLTNEGKFNADVNSTGDGITPKDAQRIQMKLLGL